MSTTFTSTSLCLLLLLAGCATFQPGDKATANKLRDFDPIPDKLSVYVCRVPAFGAGGVTSNVLLNGADIGALRPNSFVHTAVAPGKHTVMLRNDGVARNSGVLEIEGKAGELVFVWAGMTGLGLGTYTVDHFGSAKQGMNCVQSAVYSVPAAGK